MVVSQGRNVPSNSVSSVKDFYGGGTPSECPGCPGKGTSSQLVFPLLRTSSATVSPGKGTPLWVYPVVIISPVAVCDEAGAEGCVREAALSRAAVG